MRRARPVAGDERSLRQQDGTERLRSNHGVVADRTRSASAAVKLVAVLLSVWGVYISVIALGKGRSGTATGDAVGTAVRGDLAGGKDHGAGVRAGLRELNMMGFEKGSGNGRGWRTCRAYQEDKLAKDKTVSGPNSYACPASSG